MGTPKGPFCGPCQSWGGWTPHPKPRPQFTFHCWEKKEAGAQSVSAPGSQRPYGQSGAGVRSWAAPFENIIHKISCAFIF